MNDWPPSNYLISIALMLLVFTAAVIVIGDEQVAEELTIYAYYFLVTGVVIRFIELSLSEEALKKLTPASKPDRSFSIIKQQGSMYIRNTGIMFKNLYERLKFYLHRAILEMRVRISDFKKQHPPESIIAYIREIGGMLKRQYLKLRRLHIVNPRKNIVLISDISRNIAIFLSVFLLISLIYGVAIDSWFVKRYLNNLIYAILGCFTLYILLRVRF
jgi:hypothetical protein